MKESGRFNNAFRAGIAGLTLLAGATACSGEEESEVVRTISPSTQGDTNQLITGDKYEIDRIGKNVFTINGDDPEEAVRFISNSCDVISVGTWSLGGANDNHVDKRVVVVDISKTPCLPQLK